MTDKVQKIREEVARIQLYTQSEVLKQVLDYIDKVQEEPVSEELENELNKYIKDYFTIDREQLDRFGIEEKDYMYSMDKSDMLALVEHFTKWQKEQMMAKAIDAHCFGFQGAALFSFRLPADNYLVGSEVKVIVVKERNEL